MPPRKPDFSPFERAAQKAGFLMAQAFEQAAAHASRVWEEARRAFERELDPTIEDAEVLEERPATRATSHDSESSA